MGKRLCSHSIVVLYFWTVSAVLTLVMNLGQRVSVLRPIQLNESFIVLVPYILLVYSSLANKK